VTSAVLDASVVLKWFVAHGEAGKAEALDLRRRFADGELDVVVPSLLVIEILNVAGRRWGWGEQDLVALAAALDALPWMVSEAPSVTTARWVARGLTAYDATYVAVAEAAASKVVTADERMLATAPDLTVPLTR